MKNNFTAFVAQLRKEGTDFEMEQGAQGTIIRYRDVTRFFAHEEEDYGQTTIVRSSPDWQEFKGAFTVDNPDIKEQP